MDRSEFKFWCDCWLANLTLDKIDQRFVWSHDVSFENAITFSVISVQIVTDNVRRIYVIFWGCCPHNSIAYKTRIRIRFGFIDENPVDWQLNKDARIFINYDFLYFLKVVKPFGGENLKSCFDRTKTDDVNVLPNVMFARLPEGNAQRYQQQQFQLLVNNMGYETMASFHNSMAIYLRRLMM